MNIDPDYVEKISGAVLDYVFNAPWKADKSSLGGKGIFASKNIKAKQKIGIVYFQVASSGTPDERYNRTELGCLVSFSTPNAHVEKGTKNEFDLVATRDIRKGEEIFISKKNYPWT